jgi:DNA-binding CsgD family transcriptional regulator
MGNPDRYVKLIDWHPFTDKQADIINEIINGATRLEAAEALGIKDETVKKHLSNIRDKIESITGDRPSIKGLAAALLQGGAIIPEE